MWSLYFLSCCLTNVSSQFQVVMAVVVTVIEVAMEHQVVAVVVEGEEATEEEVMEVPKEAQTLSLNLTDILVFLSPKAPKILFPVNPYMVRNKYLLKVVFKA